jgi:hypothetical protein
VTKLPILNSLALTIIPGILVNFWVRILTYYSMKFKTVLLAIISVLVNNFTRTKGIPPESIWREMDGMNPGGANGKFKSKSGNFWNVYQRYESIRVKVDC